MNHPNQTVAPVLGSPNDIKCSRSLEASMSVQRWVRWLAAGMMLVAGCARHEDAPKEALTLNALTPVASSAPSNSPREMHVESATATPSISQFALYATGSVELNGGSYVHGCDVGVENTSGPYIDSSWSAYLNSSANIDTTHTLYAASVYMNGGVTIGPIDTNNFFHQGSSTYGAVNSFPTSMPAAPTMPPETAGSTSVNVNSGVTQTLAAGAYGSVMINSGATLNLSGGTYVFSQLTMNGGNVNVKAATTLSITGSVTMGSGAYMGPASGSGLTAKSLSLYLSSSAGLNINSNFELHALLVATNELVQVNTSKFFGAIAAQEIRMNSGATVTCQDGFGSSSCSGSCDDGNACTTDTCTGGTCTHTPVTNGTACNDGNACTQTDTCQFGTCTGSNPVVCTASDQCHTAGTCNTSTGACSNPVATNGTTCNDGNACTQTDTCQSGTCTGSNPVVCTAEDQCHVAGTCNASTGACTNPTATNGIACNDGNACTQTDTCQGGTCTGTNPIVCAASDQCHVAGTCNSSTGACTNPTASNGTACNDGNACTQTDSCQSGVCTGSNPVTCNASDQCHLAGTCNTATGACSNPSAPNGTSCNDGNACTQTDTCQSGTCSGSNPVVCSASDQCHTAGTCNTSTGACSNPSAANGTACNDGNACTQTDTCQSGTCAGSNPVVCSASDQCHVAGTCNTTTGACTNPAIANGTACNDGNACTQTDQCESGTCTGSNPVTCTVSDQCHIAGTCNTSTGACSNPAASNGTTCNDGNACTQADTCQSGTCTGSNPVTCTAEDQCHAAGVCSSSTGTCSQPTLANGTTCNDGNPNTVNDVCTSGVCAGTDYCIGVTCTASDQCHVAGVCNHATGVCSNPTATNGTTCNDGNACTQIDTCQSGTCTGSNPVICSASDQCHSVGTCNTATGACSNPAVADGTSCNDGNACTKTDTCASGTCVGSNLVSCAPSDQCHVAGTCSAATGTCSNPSASDGTNCSDGNACTQTDTCVSGTCTGSNPVACAASDQCHSAGTCNTTTGACTNPTAANGTTCNDGNACTQTDTCQSGTCTGSNPVTCTAADACHTVGTCDATSGKCSTPTVADGTTCSDGNACTKNDACLAGNCTGTARTCTALDQCHVAGTCNPSSGVCSNPLASDGTMCSDGNACTQVDNCKSGACVGGDPVTCAPVDQCHVAGVCDPTKGTCTSPNAADGKRCDDGNFCTQTDMCTAGTCTGTNLVVCSALDVCHTVGTCDAATGVCSQPVAPDSSLCKGGVLVSTNLPPVVTVGPNQTVAPGATLTLTGTATDDGKIAPLTTVWVQVSGPTNVPIVLPTMLTQSLTVPSEGVYVFRLKASDGQYVTTADVSITAKAPGEGTTYDPGTPGTGTGTGTTTDGAEITLLAAQYKLNFIWVAVTSKGTVVKIDSDSGQILGEYMSSPFGQAGGPSRTAVDKNGAVWVANRDGGSVVRIAQASTGGCVDRNGNGVIDTSTAQNDIRPWPNTGGADTNGGVTTAADECIVNYTLVSSEGTRHVSVDANNDVWVSGTGTPGQAFDLLDGVTGLQKRHENTVLYGGFGGLVDDHGVIWSARPLLRWDPSHPLKGANGTNWTGYASDSYGLCKDSEGNVWSTSNATTDIFKFAPNGSPVLDTNPGFTSMKSCVVDKRDNLWVGYGDDATAAVAHLTSNGEYLGSVTTGSGASGLSLDARGKVWVTNCAGNTVSRINPLLGPLGSDGTTPVGSSEFTSVDLGGSPVDYGNMTGSVSATGPSNGSWTATFNSTKTGAQWGDVQWSSWICGDSSLVLQASSSTDGVTYSAAVTASNGVPFTLPAGQYLQVTAAFERSSKGEAPQLSDVTVATLDRPLTPKTNAAPVVSAGIGGTVTLPNVGHLVGSVCDDGLPKGVIAPSWSEVSGPGTVTFTKPGAEVTDVVYPVAGTYVLRLTGNDTARTTTSDVTVTVLQANMPPVVNAGPNLAITLPNSATLSGTATDDGLPVGGSLTTTWTVVNGPGTVTIASPSALTTTATFSAAGLYVLRLSANDTALTTSADVSVMVNPPPPQNMPPVVSAGANIKVLLTDVAYLTGLVTDDGLPSGAPVTQTWTQVSGPGTTTFGDATQAITTATFSSIGSYILQLTASDTQLTGSAQMVVQVLAPSIADAGASAGGPSPTTNQAPVVSVAVDVPSGLPANTVQLVGTVTDDGLPLGSTVTQNWTLVSGPGTVAIATPTQPTTNVTFTTAGAYVLRLTASDGQLSTSADAVVYVGVTPQANAPPAVNAGTSQTILLNGTATLAGSVADDGLPTGSTVTQTWSQVSGPGTTSFANAHVTSTTATFSAVGAYVLQLTASDTQLTGSAQVVVIVQPVPGADAGSAGDQAPPANMAPVVSAGPNLSVTLPQQTVQLTGSASDDGLPLGVTPTVRWSLVSGPGTAIFGSTTAVVTPVTLSAVGTYVLRLSCSDTQFISTSDVQVIVYPAASGNTPPVVYAGASQTIQMPTLTVSLSGTVTDDGLPVGGGLSSSWAAVGASGVSIVQTSLTAATATFSGPGVYDIRLSASDGQLTGASDVIITVLSAPGANQPPTITAPASQTISLPSPVSSATPSVNGQIVASVTDDGLPVTGHLSVQIFSVSSPAIDSIVGTWIYGNDPITGLPNATLNATIPALTVAGEYQFRIVAGDGELTSSALTTIVVLQAPPPNQPPTVNAGIAQTITLPNGATLAGVVNDDGLPASGTLTALWTQQSGPGVATFADATNVTSTVSFSVAGTYVLALTADDTQLTTTGTATITVLPQNFPPVVAVGGDVTLTLPGATTTLTGTVTDDGLPTGGKLTQIWTTFSGPVPAKLGTPQASSTTATFPVPGTYVMQLTGNDSQLSTSGQTTVTVLPPTGTTGAAPVVSFSTNSSGALVQDGLQVTSPTAITGSVSDGAWAVDIALGDQDSINPANWQTIGTGSSVVNNGTVATLDPTLLLNGTYTVRLSSSNSHGSASAYIAVTVAKNMKVGVFALAFNDLTVGAQGLPIQVQRTYDSRDKTVGDFGVGWHLAAQNIRVEKSVSLGKFWYQFQDQTGFDNYYLYPLRNPLVTITFPSGKTYQFQFGVTPSVSFALPFTAVDPVYSPVNGTVGTLVATMGSEIFLPEGTPYNVPIQLLDLDENVYNPTSFALTDENGIQYFVDQTAGIQQITDLDGNTLFFSPAGITSSCGKGIQIVRDGSNRITSITDANGKTMTYGYDAAGDLSTFTDRTGNTQQYSYDDQHNMLNAMDGNGNIPANYGYDASGRLTGVTDAYSNHTAFTHDLATNTDIVTDALGHTSTYRYDDDGNVVSKTDANGKVWLSTFDGNDNQLSATDPLGNTTRMEYDSLNNKTADIDALGNRTTYTWIINRKMTSKTDPLGRVTGWQYDAYANHLQFMVDPMGAKTSYTYDLYGNQLTKTDPLGYVTNTSYNSDGTLGSMTDPLGHSLAFTDDTNGNRLSKAQTRTRSDGTVELVTMAWAYDDAGRTTLTTNADLSTRQIVYTANGRESARVDPLGRTTQYAYDVLERLTAVGYPDGTSSATTYDSVGRVASTTDRSGRTTTCGYDAVGRQTLVMYPDSSTTATSYDDTGRIVSTTDENGRTTFYGYDAVGRRTTVTDAYGKVTTTAYDVAGQVLSVTDPLGHVIQYAYDLDGRTTRTTYNDGTHTDVAYDADGRTIQVTDQAGVSTKYGLDPNGRVTSVTDALSHTTAFAYDERGSRVSQTDANGHTTKYAYDSMRRRVSRMLPLGQGETMTYDAEGRVVAKTDFNGHVTTFAYDASDRVVLRTPDASFGEAPVAFTYTTSGRRLTMSDGTGTTSYVYDVRDRLLSKAAPYGTLTYTEDAAGNVLGLRSDKSDGIAVDYEWDHDLRLASVTDRGPTAPSSGLVSSYNFDDAGRTISTVQPNGVSTAYSYDTLNRLTNLTTIGPTGNTIASYVYVLGARGNRLSVSEGSGRTVAWGYDSLYRLTSETIAGISVATGSTNYDYDSIGNRLSSNTTVPGLSARSETFDADDRANDGAWSASGSLLSEDDGATHTYDSQERLVQTPTAGVRILYDGDGNRSATDTGGVLTTYLIDDRSPSMMPQVVEERVSGEVQSVYVFGRGPKSQRRRVGGSWAVSYYERDEHGSVRSLTNEVGAVTDTYEYEAYGSVVARTGTTTNPLLYSGEWWDSAQGLQYLRARWYSPTMGRFLSADTYEGNDATPMTLNRYAYANGDPVGVVDPTGHDGEGDTVSADNGAGPSFSEWFNTFRSARATFSQHFIDAQSVSDDVDEAIDESYMLDQRIVSFNTVAWKSISASFQKVAIVPSPYKPGTGPLGMFGDFAPASPLNTGGIVVQWGSSWSMWTLHGGRLSPMTLLWHELGHSLDFLDRTASGANTDPPEAYDGTDDANIINGGEAEAAREGFGGVPRPVADYFLPYCRLSVDAVYVATPLSALFGSEDADFRRCIGAQSTP